MPPPRPHKRRKKRTPVASPNLGVQEDLTPVVPEPSSVVVQELPSMAMEVVPEQPTVAFERDALDSLLICVSGLHTLFSWLPPVLLMLQRTFQSPLPARRLFQSHPLSQTVLPWPRGLSLPVFRLFCLPGKCTRLPLTMDKTASQSLLWT